MPKPKPASKPRPVSTKPVAVTTLVDPALKRRWEDAQKRITAATHEEAADFDHKWEAVADVVFSDPPLYLAGGYSSDRDFFQRFLDVDRGTGLRKARVARFASPAQIEQWGDSKIEAALAWVEAKAGGPLQGRLPLALDKVRIPAKVDGKDAQLSLDQASREQVRAATRALLGEHSAKVKASPRARVVQAALASAGLKAVVIASHRDSVDLKGIPWDKLAALGKALATVKLPKEAASPK